MKGLDHTAHGNKYIKRRVTGDCQQILLQIYRTDHDNKIGTHISQLIGNRSHNITRYQRDSGRRSRGNSSELHDSRLFLIQRRDCSRMESDR